MADFTCMQDVDSYIAWMVNLQVCKVLALS